MSGVPWPQQSAGHGLRGRIPDSLTRGRRSSRHPIGSDPNGVVEYSPGQRPGLWVPLSQFPQAEGLQERDEFLQAFSLRSVCLVSRLPGALPLAMFLRPFRAPVPGWWTSTVRLETTELGSGQ